MILVVNPNPALDRVAVVRFRPRATLRTERSFIWPGGSGIHAGHVAKVLGADVEVVGFQAGATGRQLEHHVRLHGLEGEWIAATGETRQTFSLLDLDAGNVCDVVEPGPQVDASAVARFEAAVRTRLAGASVVVLSGSLPDGCPEDLLVRIAEAARQLDVRVIADLQGAALESTAAAAPWMIKPSLEEITQLLEHAPEGTELMDRLHGWRDLGVGHVCLSMGERGLVWLSRDGLRHLLAPRVVAFNSIGCGDTLVGATAAAWERSGDVAAALREGVAAATDNLRHDAPGHCDPAEVAQLIPLIQDRPIDAQDLQELLRMPDARIPAGTFGLAS